jgi:hypothetical protein
MEPDMSKYENILRKYDIAEADWAAMIAFTIDNESPVSPELKHQINTNPVYQSAISEMLEYKWAPLRSKVRNATTRGIGDSTFEFTL